jgi:peptidoglycan DL-endopeptidase CwlO
VTQHRIRLRTTLTGAAAAAGLIAAGILAAPSTSANPERIAQIEAELEALSMDQAYANEQVLTAQYEYDQLTSKMKRTESKVASAKSDLKETQGSIGRYAAAAYRTGGIDSSLQLLLADDPQEFLDSAVVLDIVANSQNAALRKGQVARLKLAQATAELTQQQAQAEVVLATMEANKATLEDKIAETEAYLEQLKEEERQRLEEERKRREAEQRAAAAAAAAAIAENSSSSGSSSGSSSSGSSSSGSSSSGSSGSNTSQQGGPNDNGSLTESNGGGGSYSGGSGVSSDRAAIAVSAALAQLGEPYVNTPPGAVPPHSWDCSKLTAWAWGQAGVRLTPYSYVQSREVRQISTDELQPGDLLFYFQSGAHHVSMYIGGGQIIEASSPSTGVRITSLWNSWNTTHFSWAGRPYG